MLEVARLSKHFGGVRAVDELDFRVEAGEIFGLIGPNGSGKSTTVNMIAGIFAPTAGEIIFDGVDITEAPPHITLHAGIARTFQNIRLFNNMTVWENLWVAQNSAKQKRTGNPLARWMGGSRRAAAAVEEFLEFSNLAHKRDELAGNLAFGEQRRLEVARSLAAEPKFLLLDEPAAGMNLEEVKELDERLRVLRDRGVTILLVEHVMELVMEVTDRIAVLNFGRKIAEGTPSEVQKNQAVMDAYLGAGEGGSDA